LRGSTELEGETVKLTVRNQAFPEFPISRARRPSSWDAIRLGNQMSLE